MRSRFYQPVILIVLSLAFVFLGCGGGGGGGDGGGDTGPFDMAAFFPLSSSWQTDNWTLMVDEVEYDINGLVTKAMVDTRDPTVFFWTNDENGWRLHGFIDADGFMVVFEPPILFSNSSCSVGDIHQGAFSVDGQEISYSIELAGVENVSVPAGTFNKCLKFKLKLWPSSELPSQYGYETFWLAKNVGFVKAVADANAESELFTDSGETRRLLSYHITPTDMTAEEKAIRAASTQLNEYFSSGDIDSVMTMISDNYFDRRCRDKAAVESSWRDFLDNISGIMQVRSIEDITVNGADAYVLREYFSTYTMNDTGEQRWDWNRELRRWKKENGQWKVYGAHLDNFRPGYIGVWLRNDGGRPPGTEEHGIIYADFLKCDTGEYIDDPPDVIQSLTVTGPPGSGITDLDLKPCWIGDIYPTERYFWCPDALVDAVSGFYTYRVEDAGGDYYVFTDYLELTPHLAIPVQVAPVHDAVEVPVNVTLDWDPVDLAEIYRVDMRYSDDGGNTWMGMPNQHTADDQVTVDLDPGTHYIWRVRARRFDVYGEMDTESRTDWSEFQTAGG